MSSARPIVVLLRWRTLVSASHDGIGRADSEARAQDPPDEHEANNRADDDACDGAAVEILTALAAVVCWYRCHGDCLRLLSDLEHRAGYVGC